MFDSRPSKKIARRAATVAAAIVLACHCGDARAYMPFYEPDFQIATRAELIVVGRIKEGSVRYLPVPEHWGNATVKGFCPQATLVVSEVVDGKLKEKEITLWFRGGTLPVVGGVFV